MWVRAIDGDRFAHFGAVDVGWVRRYAAGVVRVTGRGRFFFHELFFFGFSGRRRRGGPRCGSRLDAPGSDPSLSPGVPELGPGPCSRPFSGDLRLTLGGPLRLLPFLRWTWILGAAPGRSKDTGQGDQHHGGPRSHSRTLSRLRAESRPRAYPLPTALAGSGDSVARRLADFAAFFDRGARGDFVAAAA